MKKIVLLLLSISILICLVACNQGQNQVPTPEHTHNFGEWDVTKHATCTEDGTKVRYCSCGEKQSEIVVSLRHSPAEAVRENEISPTCTNDGSYSEVVRCSYCNEMLSEKTYTLPKTSHTLGEAVVENNVSATCYSEGSYEIVVYCTDCSAELERVTHAISKLEHTPASAVKENNLDASCTEDGSYDEVVYCSNENCNAEISRETKAIDAKGHFYVYGKCEDCDALDANFVPYYSEGLEYVLSDDGTYYILADIGTCTDRDIVIPLEYNGLPIKAIGAHPEKDGSFDSYPFADPTGCSYFIAQLEVAIAEGKAFTQIEIPESLYNIDSITMFGNIENISELSFFGLFALHSINVVDSEYFSSSSGVLYSADKKTLIEYPWGRPDECFVIPNGVENFSMKLSILGKFSFYNKLESIEIPESMTSWNPYSFLFSSVSIIVNENNQYMKSVDGNVYSKDGTHLIWYGDRKNDTEFIIPDGVTNIANYAFCFSTNLTSVVIPQSVTSIDREAFEACYSLESIVIPDSVTSIGYYAFSLCTSLTSIVIPDSVTSIGDHAFYNCSSLTSVVIPDSVTSIGEGAFHGCSKLKDVYYTGSEEAWKAITIGSSDSYLSKATKHYNYVPEN